MEEGGAQYKLLINGQLEDGASSMKVLDPATEEVLSECPRADKAQLERGRRRQGGLSLLERQIHGGAPKDFQPSRRHHRKERR